MRKFGLSAAALKWIALISMTMDHIGVWCNLFGYRTLGKVLRIIGRMAAPVYLFLITESLRYTRSRPKLMLRLYVGAVAHGVICLLLEAWTGQSGWNGNIFPTLFYTVLTVTAIDELRKKKPFWMGVLLLFAVGGYFTRNLPHVPLVLFYVRNVEYSALFVALGVLWYYLPRRSYQIVLFLLLCAASCLIPSSQPVIQLLRFTPLFSSIQRYMVLAVPLMLLYNGQKGRSSRWFFYLYYPIHQYILLFFAIILKIMLDI